MSEPTIEEQIEALPEKTGVYIMKGDEILYVGKASNIRERVKNHFQAAKSNPREALIVGGTKRVDYIITGSEVEALVEENILIKQYRPKFNVRLRDDKTYPYLKLSLEDEYPNLSIVRRPRKDGNRYYGPYADVAAMRRSFNTLRRLFPLTACKYDPKRPKKRPCTYYQIGLCSGICAGLISKDEYNERVKELILVLEGKAELVIDKLHKEMLDASANLEFEKAAIIRDRLASLEKTLSGSTVAFPKPVDMDILGLAKTPYTACVQILQIKAGRLVSSESFELNAQGAEDSEIMESFIKQYYSRRTTPPPEIVLSTRLIDIDTIQEWMFKKFGVETIISFHVKGQKRRLAKLAVENARAHLEELSNREVRKLKALHELQKILGLEATPRLIECFDVSTLAGRESVGSMVAFMDGEPLKSRYRRFRIKTVMGQDDPKMIGELVHRRYRRLLEEGTQLPNLIIVDGGVTQLNFARRSLSDLGLELPIIGLAKRLENIYLPGQSEPVELPKDSEGLYLIQRIRDEAHRFALSYHRKLRVKTEFSNKK
ncbi:MAG: excinuclease ABC subunit UvrC [Candidatus Bathyarchaeia archaeon]